MRVSDEELNKISACLEILQPDTAQDYVRDFHNVIADLRDAREAARLAISEIYGHLCVNEFCEGQCPTCVEHEKLLRKLQDVIGPIA